MAKPKPSESAEDAKKVIDEAKNFLEKAIEDIGKTTATKQLILGTASGWVTGFLTMKVGKVAAIGIGSGVILLHIAQQKGYIDINWDKVNKKFDKFNDKIEEKISGESPDLVDKLGRFVDRKLDKAENLLKKKEVKAKKWLHKATGDGSYHATETHVFLASFAAGLAVGILCGQ